MHGGESDDSSSLADDTFKAPEVTTARATTAVAVTTEVTTAEPAPTCTSRAKAIHLPETPASPPATRATPASTPTGASPSSTTSRGTTAAETSGASDDAYSNVEVTQDADGVYAGSHGLQFYLSHGDELGRWYEYEIMLKANTAGERDGRVILWLDGEVIADFQNLRFRDTDELTMNRVGLSLHAGTDQGPDTYKWYDNGVSATSYIGPMVE
jgi:hypothetical protein